jgi:quercetin dioxygenase-like cupin family protein
MTASKGLFRKPGDLGARTGVEGHPKVTVHPLLQSGEEGSLYLVINYNEIEPGGSSNPHYHKDCDVFDHVHYILSGDILASVDGREFKAGPDSLVYCRSDELHSFKNVGSETARVLLISGLNVGGTGGKLVFPED